MKTQTLIYSALKQEFHYSGQMYFLLNNLQAMHLIFINATISGNMKFMHYIPVPKKLSTDKKSG